MISFEYIATQFLCGSAIFCAITSPLAFWEHFAPHIDAHGAAHDLEAKEREQQEREFQEYLDKSNREFHDRLFESELKAWCKKEGLPYYDRGGNDRNQHDREGTCGPPDRDR